jgi:hypothetical protein
MNAIKAVTTEIIGLFVDSGSLAVAILVWLAIVGLGLSRSGVLAPYAGIVLFLGLLAILLQSVIARALQRPAS